jgi:hypothetical protein
MSPLARIDPAGSIRAVFRAAVVLLAWLALWFSVLIATLDRPLPRPSPAPVRVSAAPRA